MNENLQNRKYLSSRKCALLIFYVKDEGQWLMDWEYNQNKTYSDVFLSNEVKQIYLSLAHTHETASMAFISVEENKMNLPAAERRGIEDFSVKSLCMRGNTSPAPPVGSAPRGGVLNPKRATPFNKLYSTL